MLKGKAVHAYFQGFFKIEVPCAVQSYLFAVIVNVEVFVKGTHKVYIRLVGVKA